MTKAGWKPKALWTNNPQRVGNAILYGKEPSIYRPEIMLNLVETDFGNRMRLTDNELDELYTIGPIRDYDEWKLDRDNLRITNLLKDLEDE
jgi:hypothetical protein